MKLGSANIKNFKDMPPKFVLEDAHTMAQNCGIWGGQEIQPDEDTEVVLKGLGPGWDVSLPDTDIPFFFKTKNYVITEASVDHIPFEPVLPLTPRPRLITSVVVKRKNRPHLPPFAVINSHKINGGYNGDRHTERRRQWDIEFRHEKTVTQIYEAQGLTVFNLGDYNRLENVWPTQAYKWLTTPGIDKIGHTLKGSVRVEINSTHRISLHSDHDGRVVDVTLFRRD